MHHPSHLETIALLLFFCRGICEGLRELTTSTPALRSALFRTEAVDGSLLAALVDLPARQAAQRARWEHIVSESEGPLPDHPSSKLARGPGPFFYAVESCLTLHPVLTSLCSLEKTKTGKDRKMNIRIHNNLFGVEEYDFMRDNATEPPVSQIVVQLPLETSATRTALELQLASPPLHSRSETSYWAGPNAGRCASPTWARCSSASSTARRAK